MQSERQHEWKDCSCSRRGRICVCVPRKDLDPMIIHVMNESHRLRVLDELHMELERDLMGVDAKWVLFGMAIQSYRYEQLVVPYPSAYATPEGLNIDTLSFVVGTMTELTEFQRRLLQKVLPPEQVELLHWLLIQSGTPQLRQLSRNEKSMLWRQLEQRPDPRPHLIFSVQPRSRDVQPVEPLDIIKCIYYCGDMEELYAMISNQNFDLGKSDLEFYEDLQQACCMAEWCPGWGYSICGTLLRCVAVCQLLPQETADSAQLLQVRYLLIYSMNYTPKMQGVRRRQWKKIQQRQLIYQQLELELDQRTAELQQQHKQTEQRERELEREQEQKRKSLRKRDHSQEFDEVVETDQLQLLQPMAKRSKFHWLFCRNTTFVVLGVLTVTSLGLMAVKMRHLRQ